MDTITTIHSLLTFSGSAQPVMVALTPKDSRLIAAASELLDALIWMVENDDTYEGDTPLPDHSGATWNEINAFWIAGVNKARAAIAKATGEQP